MQKQIKQELQQVSNEIDSESANSQSYAEFVNTEKLESVNQTSYSVWSNKNLSSKIKSLVEELQSTTYKELFPKLIDGFSNELQQLDETKRELRIKKIKRRMYDAVNVMVGMGVLSKEKKIISFHKVYRGMLLEKIKNTKRAIVSKKEKIKNAIEKFKLLKDLIKRNQQSKSENEVVDMPVIGVSVPLQGNDFQMCQKSGGNLLLQSKKPIHIYSELDILRKITY